MRFSDDVILETQCIVVVEHTGHKEQRRNYHSDASFCEFQEFHKKRRKELKKFGKRKVV
jgi:hypothetical protein